MVTINQHRVDAYNKALREVIEAADRVSVAYADMTPDERAYTKGAPVAVVSALSRLRIVWEPGRGPRERSWDK